MQARVVRDASDDDGAAHVKILTQISQRCFVGFIAGDIRVIGGFSRGHGHSFMFQLLRTENRGVRDDRFIPLDGSSRRM